MEATVKSINVEQLVATPSAESFGDRMTSLEIAEITGREHKNVLRDIRNILSQGVQQLNFEPMQKQVPTNNGGYKEIPCYNLTKKGCLILASGYEALLREKIIDRWEYLEKKNKANMPNFANPAEAARAWADQYERNLALEAKNQELKPKADYFDSLVDRHLNINFRDTAKEIGLKQNDFIRKLIDAKYIYRDTKNQLKPYAAYVGTLFIIKECKSGDRWAGNQTLVTPKGRETFNLLFSSK